MGQYFPKLNPSFDYLWLHFTQAELLLRKFFALDRFVLSPGNRIDHDIKIPEQAGGKIFAVQDKFTRKAFQLASIKVIQAEPVNTPDMNPPTAGGFIPAQMFANVKVGKTWDLNAIRGGKFGIGWTMNRQLWPDADKVDYRLGVPQKVIFKTAVRGFTPCTSTVSSSGC